MKNSLIIALLSLTVVANAQQQSGGARSTAGTITIGQVGIGVQNTNTINIGTNDSTKPLYAYILNPEQTNILARLQILDTNTGNWYNDAAQRGYFTKVVKLPMGIVATNVTTNWNYALGPEICLTNIGRATNLGIQFQSIGIWCGDTQALNIKGILLTTAPEASWVSAAAVAISSASMLTNYAGYIDLCTTNPLIERSIIGTNQVITYKNIGLLCMPLSNNLFMHFISETNSLTASLTNKNESYIRIAVSQD